MEVGKKVICVNDTFASWVHDLYDQLPVKDQVYTIRAVGIGREILLVRVKGVIVKNGGSDSKGGAVYLLLDELINPPDPFCRSRELGFTSERFAPLEEESEENADKVEDAIEVESSI